MNSSVSTVHLWFPIYGALALYKSELVFCVFLLYLSALCMNLFLVVVICVDPSLHRPMYVLLVHLAVGGTMGSSSVCPLVIRQLLSRREASLQGCLTQVFFANVYGGCVFCVLALMAFDRYVSICKPLLYHSIVTPARVRVMLLTVYLLLSSSSAVQVFLTSRLRLCRHVVDKLLCDSLVISKLSCEQTTVISVFGLCCAVCWILFPFFVVILSYVQIFTVVQKTSKESRWRALQTCTPHLLTFINFSVATFFGVVYNRLGSDVPKPVNIFTCVNFFVVPSLLHPIIYGIKMEEIRQSAQKMMKTIGLWINLRTF